MLLPGYACFVELKRPGCKPEPGQERELQRLRTAGLNTRWFASKLDIDAWIARLELLRDDARWQAPVLEEVDCDERGRSL